MLNQHKTMLCNYYCVIGYKKDIFHCITDGIIMPELFCWIIKLAEKCARNIFKYSIAMECY